MTILGKIFTMLILVMSVAFMAFSTMVFITHKNWKTYATNTDTAGGAKLGLEQQLANERATNKQLKDELARAQNILDAELAARRAALASLQVKAASLEKDLAGKEAELRDLIANHGKATEAMQTTTTQLASITEEIGTLRNELRTAQGDRDVQFSTVVALTDSLNQAEGLKSRLEERGQQLAGQLTQMTHILKMHGISMEYPPKAKQLPVDGVVKALGKDDLIEITIGNDDGVKEGHELDVYRGGQYLARIQIRKTGPDSAVGQIIPKTKRGQIRVGDNVTSKLSS